MDKKNIGVLKTQLDGVIREVEEVYSSVDICMLLREHAEVKRDKKLKETSNAKLKALRQELNTRKREIAELMRKLQTEIDDAISKMV